MFPPHIRLQPDMIYCWVQVDILVVNCSLFNPTPSLSAMIINHFKMRSNIVSYNLAGMGCSAGVIAVNLAKELLQAGLHASVFTLLLFACGVCLHALACLLACMLHHAPSAALCCQTSSAAQLLACILRCNHATKVCCATKSEWKLSVLCECRFTLAVGLWS